MKKAIIIFVIFTLVGTAWSANFIEQSTPLTPPEPPINSSEILTPPSPPPTSEFTSLGENRGYFGWQCQSELTGLYLLNRSGQHGLFGLLGGLINIKFADPYYLGRNLGLAQDALEFKAGGGIIIGYDVDDRPLLSIPCQLETTLYLKEGSFYELDPFLGGGLNFNLLGTDWQFGGLGIRLYAGVLTKLGPKKEKIALSIGYSNYRITDNRLAEGYFIAISQPLTL